MLFKKIMKILIVEDEPSLVTILKNKFTREHFTVIEARDGKEGLAVAFNEHPDLILLDIIMPVMDGISMLNELRKDTWGKTAKVILLTNLSDSQKIDESLAQGVSDYLIKADWQLDDLVTKVKEKLKEKR